MAAILAERIYSNSTMQDDKEYYEVFHKDTRNKRATGNAKGRNNAKETREKLNKLEKRHLPSMEK